ncbi:MAG: hypothetical protein H6573_29935 [Lewinellaceae bacterium]|nr:hypothetical protein [Bacteroidota bacterium]MCB9351684.1 hypothetical protein [Lewinellaceae bacterium]
MNTVSELILQLKKETSQITSNPVLEKFKIPLLREFEEKAKQNMEYEKK